MKFILYKSLDSFYVTNEKNYRSYIQDARKIYQLYGCTTPQEAIECACRNFKCTVDNLILVNIY